MPAPVDDPPVGRSFAVDLPPNPLNLAHVTLVDEPLEGLGLGASRARRLWSPNWPWPLEVVSAGVLRVTAHVRADGACVDTPLTPASWSALCDALRARYDTPTHGVSAWTSFFADEVTKPPSRGTRAPQSARPAGQLNPNPRSRSKLSRATLASPQADRATPPRRSDGGDEGPFTRSAQDSAADVMKRSLKQRVERSRLQGHSHSPRSQPLAPCARRPPLPRPKRKRKRTLACGTEDDSADEEDSCASLDRSSTGTTPLARTRHDSCSGESTLEESSDDGSASASSASDSDGERVLRKDKQRHPRTPTDDDDESGAEVDADLNLTEVDLTEVDADLTEDEEGVLSDEGDACDADADADADADVNDADIEE